MNRHREEVAASRTQRPEGAVSSGGSTDPLRTHLASGDESAGVDSSSGNGGDEGGVQCGRGGGTKQYPYCPLLPGTGPPESAGSHTPVAPGNGGSHASSMLAPSDAM